MRDYRLSNIQLAFIFDFKFASDSIFAIDRCERVKLLSLCVMYEECRVAREGGMTRRRRGACLIPAMRLRFSSFLILLLSFVLSGSIVVCLTRECLKSHQIRRSAF